MKILFVQSVAEISTWDVSRGYRSALERQGHDIRDYVMKARFDYHRRALPEGVNNDTTILSRQACENIVVEALYHESDLVVIVSGLNVHPIALWLLGQVGIPACVILTESPYDDESQAQWADLTHVGGKVDLTVFTNDRYSAVANNWHLLAPAYDPALHRPVPVVESDVCDVLLVGTGWGERQAFLEAVDWNGIDLRLYGVWPNILPDSPLSKFYSPMVVDNARIAELYSSSKVCLNFHRRSAVAMTPGPRAYELAACGAFQLSDSRPDLVAMFGDSVPTFDSPEQLGQLIRYYLANPDERLAKASRSLTAVQGNTFDTRAATLIDIVTYRPKLTLVGTSPVSGSTA